MELIEDRDLRLITRYLLILLGSVALILGVVGIFLPLLPTTPFVLAAAACFSKSSPRCHGYLLNHRIFGPIVSDWESYGVIRPRAKVLAVTMILALSSYPLLIKPIDPMPRFLAATTVLCVILFIVSRPSTPSSTKSS